MSNDSRRPKGSPGSTGGQFDFKPGGAGDLPPLDGERARINALRAPGDEKGRHPVSFEDTQRLLAQAESVEIDPLGIHLYGPDGEPVYVEEAYGPRLDPKALRADKRVRRASRDILRGRTMTGLSGNERRRMMRNAFRSASPYERRLALDTSEHRADLPAEAFANSYRHRRDKERALDELTRLFYEDPNVAANVVRNGFPNDKHGAFTFINRTKVKREKPGEGEMIGRAISEERTVCRKDAKGRQLVGRDGKPLMVTKKLNVPNPVGAEIRAYLRMRFEPNNGTPTPRQTHRLVAAIKSFDDDPQMQAEVFYGLCYGSGTDDRRPEAKGDANGAELSRWTTRRGQGNAARMVAYQKALTPEAAAIFLDMGAEDGRHSHTAYRRNRWNHETGTMEQAKPKRLTEMHRFIEGLYPQASGHGGRSFQIV